MAKRYRSQDERVLQHMVDNASPSDEYISRTRARYGMLSMSAAEFDEVLNRHGITTHYEPNTKGQRYKVTELAKALQTLIKAYETVEHNPFVFSKAEEDATV